MITPRSYYKGNISIPNAFDTAPNSNLLGNGTDLDLFREQYERDVLTKCLGYSLYSEFQSSLEIVSPETTLQTLKGSADEKWGDLIDGKEYQIGDVTYRWKGLLNNNESMIAFYVFHFHFKKNIKSYTGIGLVQEQGKGSKHMEPSKLYVDSYNWFYNWAIGSYYDCNTADYDYKSLYQFISDMNGLDETTYPNWMPYKFPKLNIMGI